MRKRNKTITIRCTEQEQQKITNKAREHNLTLSDFILRSALGKKIVVAAGLDEVIKQQKAIGKNLNQIAALANMNRLKAVNLEELLAEHSRATALLGEILREVK